eukprot:CAMPEP_0206616726 /NCGR_PEP_ID=MMETSP0325_2-20121206/59177_1 /ASSEMBLY_ACC=CAM_ASM_000347 /TAXON_ID=2866 /ORGANISM="Crypthecodinium cohnii, Strain Seligo" /LENGTH=213 /DNA_ID=CAMNT_0054138505 /DNA_START=99 /DNA_END=737 /DNA_ORIENTATION=-
MPQATQTPIIAKTPSAPGPAITYALCHPSDRESAKKPRAKWNGRHQLMWPNDALPQNTRSYFDRFVPHVDQPQFPRRRLRPTWLCEIPTKEANDGTYRIFDPATASWKEVTRFAYLPPPQKPKSNLKQPGSKSRRSQSTPALPLPAPIKPKKPIPAMSEADINLRAELEKSWNQSHHVVFSRFNDKFQANVRSYFDRWKEEEGGDYLADKGTV